jgi:hypothetical protein
MERKTMKRTLTISIALLLLIGGLLGTPAQAAAPVKACADITGDSGQSYYEVDAPGNAPDEAILSIQITTFEALCSSATLTVFVSTDGTTFTGYTYPGDTTSFTSCGASCLTFTYNYGPTDKAKTSAAPPTVYVYLESAIGGRVVDRAPDSGAPAFVVCDFDPKHKNYDNTGTVIPPCNPPGGNYFL